MPALFRKRSIGDLIRQGEMKKLTRLINDNNVHMKDEEGKTPLFYALKYNNLEALNLLLEYNIHINLGDRNELLAKLVLDSLDPGIISLMMDRGVKMEMVVDNDGKQYPALHYLIHKRVIPHQLLSFFIEQGIDINALNHKQETPIQSALGQGYCDKNLVKLLISHACQVEFQTKWIEDSLLYKALYTEGRNSRDAIELFEMLLPHMKDCWEQEQLELLNKAYLHRSAEIFLHLISRLTQNGSLGMLHLESFLTKEYFTPQQQKRLIEIDEQKGLRLPIEFHPDSKARLHKHRSAVIHCVSQYNSDQSAPEQLASLLESGYPIEEDGQSALLLAARNHSLDAIKLLLDHGADPLYIDRSGISLISALVNSAVREKRDTSIISLAAVLKGLSTELKKDTFVQLLETASIQTDKEETQSFVKYISTFNRYKIEFYAIIAAAMDNGEQIYRTLMQLEERNIKIFLDGLRSCTISDESRTNIISYLLDMPVGTEGMISFLKHLELSEDDPLLIEMVKKYNKNSYSQDSVIGIARYLIQRGINIDYQNHQGESVLSAAVKRGAVEILCWAISSGADTTAPIGEEQLSLQNYAVCTVTDHSLEIIKLLDSCGKLALEEGGIFNITPLLSAARVCSVDVVKYLLEKGADPRADEYETKTTPLIAAISYDAKVKNAQRISCVELLLDHGADINTHGPGGMTPLMYAVYYGALSIVRLLLNRGADVSILDEKGCNVINYLSMGSWDYEYRKNNSCNEIIRAQMLQLLVAKGAEMDHVPSTAGCVPALIDSLGYNCPSLFHAYIDAGADINIKDREGTPLFHYALRYNAKPFIKILLSCTMLDAGTKDSEGSSAWHALALVKEKSALTRYATILEERNIAIESNIFKIHPLHTAVFKANLPLVHYLIRHDHPSVNYRDDHGRSPLFYLFLEAGDSRSKLDICKALIDAGADLNIRSSDGSTPLGLSKEAKMMSIHKLLLNGGADASWGDRKIGF